MKEELFVFIQELLAAVTAIKHYDWWNNQPENENEEDVFECPAAFVQIAPFKAKSLGRKRIAADIDFMLHLVHQPIKRTRRGHRQQAAALQRLKTDDVVNALKGKNNTTTIGSIAFVMEYPDHSFDQYTDTPLAFKVRMVSDTSVKETSPATGRGDVTHVNP
jgi:hypothetical protein